MRIAVGSDHAGRSLRLTLAEHITALGHTVTDLGTHGEESVDYPDFGAAVASAVVSGDADLGVCVCGSGIGIAMAANKVAGARAATVHDVTSARLAREHNDANVMCVGERFLGVETARDAVTAFLGASFAGGRHSGRVEKLAALDAARCAD
jgi:ribose 5-phosphate isomerase B